MAWCRQATSHYLSQFYPDMCSHMAWLASLGHNELNHIEDEWGIKKLDHHSFCSTSSHFLYKCSLTVNWIFRTLIIFLWNFNIFFHENAVENAVSTCQSFCPWFDILKMGSWTTWDGLRHDYWRYHKSFFCAPTIRFEKRNADFSEFEPCLSQPQCVEVSVTFWYRT